MTYPGNRTCRGAIAAVGLALLVSTAVPAQAQEAVLLTSTVPGYVPGMLVGTGERLVLPDGASATLLFRSGEVLRLHGPFDGPLALPSNGGSGGAVAALASAFRLQGVDATVIGGTRARPPSHTAKRAWTRWLWIHSVRARIASSLQPPSGSRVRPTMQRATLYAAKGR